jgi:protein SDA1
MPARALRGAAGGAGRAAADPQSATPLLDAVARRARSTHEAPFHVPGHKRGAGAPPALAALLGGGGALTFAADLTELAGLDLLSAPDRPIAEAQALAARAWGAGRSFFLVNGSTAGIHAAVLAACTGGERETRATLDFAPPASAAASCPARVRLGATEYQRRRERSVGARRAPHWAALHVRASLTRASSRLERPHRALLEPRERPRRDGVLRSRPAHAPGAPPLPSPPPLALSPKPHHHLHHHRRPQGHIKRDPHGYADEFDQQWRHYQACLALFRLQPGQPSGEFQALVAFVAHASAVFPERAGGLVGDLIGLLDAHGAAMEPPLRAALAKALILLRNRRQLAAGALLPPLFRLFRLRDKALRALVARHVVADIRAANKKARNERVNRAAQAFLYSAISDEHEGTAKRALAVLTEMWRRRVWRDARTVNAIAAATQHPSPRILLAALKFFLGQDEAAAAGDASDSDDDDDAPGKGGGKGGGGADAELPAAPSKQDMHAAFKMGTVSSKKKKQRKIARVQAAVRRAERRASGGGGAGADSFAALQLLHDPQGFAERLFARLRAGKERFETRLATIAVLSRAVGVHKLLLLNFYPFLQRYIAPAQRDAPAVLAALAQACHELVPPEALAPVIRQLADQFVHDRARPEVAVLGLKAVREVCARAPLAMDADLLQELVGYRKSRDKEVGAAARALAAFFREAAPAMLAKRDRGRGGAEAARPLAAYGAAPPAAGVDGLELLEAARAEGLLDADGALIESSADERRSSDSESDLGEEEESGSEEEEGEPGSEPGSGEESGSEEEEAGEELSGSGDEAGGSSGSEEGEEASGSESEGEEAASGSDAEAKGAAGAGAAKRAPADDSLATLRRRLAAKCAPAAAADGDGYAAAAGGTGGAVPADWGRILTQADFAAIRTLKRRRLVADAMATHGLKSASQRAKAVAAAGEEADAALRVRARLGTAHEERLDPASLLARKHERATKAERVASILEGREGREFGAKARRKKNKPGGLSNREKDRKKNLPAAARVGQMRKRQARQRTLKRSNNFKGHVRK